MRTIVEQAVSDDACVLKVHGDLDMVSVPDVEQAFGAALGQGMVDFVLDLSGVSYADSSALGLIVWMDRQLVPRSGRLVLAGANRNVSRVLEMSGLVGLAPTLSAAETARDALAGLSMRARPSAPLWRRELSLPAVPSSLARMRDDVCELLVPLSVPEPVMFDVRVAVGEAVSNAIRHGSPQGEADAIDVMVTAHDDRVVLEIRDYGKGFDGTACVPEDVYAASGRGVLFMRALMDQVDFDQIPGGGTKVTLVKHLGRDGLHPETETS